MAISGVSVVPDALGRLQPVTPDVTADGTRIAGVELEGVASQTGSAPAAPTAPAATAPATRVSDDVAERSRRAELVALTGRNPLPRTASPLAAATLPSAVDAANRARDGRLRDQVSGATPNLRAFERTVVTPATFVQTEPFAVQFRPNADIAATIDSQTALAVDARGSRQTELQQREERAAASRPQVVAVPPLEQIEFETPVETDRGIGFDGQG